MNTLLCSLFLLSLTPAAEAAPPRGGAKVGVGIGGGLGVSGLSGKFWLPGDGALQVVVGGWGYGREVWGPDYGYGVGVGVDYLWEMPELTRSGPLVLGWNLGLGGTVATTEPAWVGVSGVAGLEFDFQPVPIDLTLEYRPGMRVTPGLGLDLINFSGHARVHF